MFNRANIVGILIKAKKHGLVFFDGEIVFAVSCQIIKAPVNMWLENNIEVILTTLCVISI